MFENNEVQKIYSVPFADDVFFEQETKASNTPSLVDEQQQQKDLELTSWAKVEPFLPPLLPPKKIRNQQTLVGCSLVILFIAVIVVITTGALFYGNFGPIQVILAIIVYLLALIALYCVVCLVTKVDTGIIRRSEQTCMPLPNEVKERIITLTCNNNEKEECVSLNGLANLADEQKNIYCIRCCIWRRRDEEETTNTKRKKSFHCSVCEHCVEQFDHHCGVFGRCIAGNGLLVAIEEGKLPTKFQGNMIYFETICIVGMLGVILAIVTSAVSLIQFMF